MSWRLFRCVKCSSRGVSRSLGLARLAARSATSGVAPSTTRVTASSRRNGHGDEARGDARERMGTVQHQPFLVPTCADSDVPVRVPGVSDLNGCRFVEMFIEAEGAVLVLPLDVLPVAVHRVSVHRQEPFQGFLGIGRSIGA